MAKLTKVLFGVALLSVLSAAGCSQANDPTAPAVRPQHDGDPTCIMINQQWYCN